MLSGRGRILLSIFKGRLQWGESCGWPRSSSHSLARTGVVMVVCVCEGGGEVWLFLWFGQCSYLSEVRWDYEGSCFCLNLSWRQSGLAWCCCSKTLFVFTGRMLGHCLATLGLADSTGPACGCRAAFFYPPLVIWATYLTSSNFHICKMPTHSCCAN